MYVLRNLIIPTKKLQARNSGTARFLMQSPIEIYEAFIDKARKRRNHDTLDMIGLSQHFSKYNRVWWKLNQAVCYGFQRQCFVSVVFCDVKHRILLFFFFNLKCLKNNKQWNWGRTISFGPFVKRCIRLTFSEKKWIFLV